MESNLPQGWTSCALEEVVEIHNNLRKPVNATERSKRVGPYPYYGATGQVGWIDDFRQDGEYVLLGEDGAPFFDITKSKAYLVSGKCWVNNHAHVLKGREGICSNKYLLHFLNQVDYRGFVNGTTRLKLTQAAMRRIPIDIAPKEEQNRIVAKIEELFSELDSGVASLKTAQQQLSLYRQSLLKHAFEGKLTEQWRKDNADKLETPEQLLARIQQERETRYQQQLEEWQQAVKDWEAKDKEGKRPRRPANLKKLKPLEQEDLLHLPKVWSWVKIGELVSVGTGVTPKKSNEMFYKNGSIPWVTSGALNETFVRGASDYVTEQALDETSLRQYKPHTLLIAMYGEGRTRGKCSELLIEATTNQAVAALETNFLPSSVRQFMKLFFFKNYQDMRMLSSGGVQPNLNLGIIENMAIPFCSLAEQEEIVSQLEEKLSIIEQNEKEIEAALAKAELLRQSILKKAFSGRLVIKNKE